MTHHKVPMTLKRDETKEIWKKINHDWKLDFDHRVILQKALEFLERSMEAREILDRDGLCFETAQGVIKKHPAIEIQKIADGQFLMAWRMLNLGVEAPLGIGRPGTGGH